MEELNNLDIYEVEKRDYEAYFYRLPQNEIMKMRPQEGLTVYKDIITGDLLCGVLSEQVMAMPANRYFIFNLMDEERLGEHKLYKYIQLSQEEFNEFLAQLQQAAKKENNNA